MTRVSIVTAYYKNEAMTKDWLENIRDKVDPDDEVIVVNAGSDLIDVSVYGHNFIRVDLPMNRSFSNSMNAGLKEARGDYFCIIGNDGFPVDHNWLDKLIEAQARTGADIVSPEPTNPKLNTYNSKIIKRTKEYWYYSMFPAICWFMPRYVVDSIGYFDEQFLIGCYEDDDYCRRVRNKGGDIIVVPGVMVRHLLSQTVGQHFNLGQIMSQNRKRYEDKWRLK